VIKSISNSQLLPTGGDPVLATVGGIAVAILVTVVLPLVVSIKLELPSIRMYRTTTLAPGHLPDYRKAQRQEPTAPAPDELPDGGASDVS
jgi:hypothetical protein